MNAEMKNYVIKLLETYHDRERMIAVLRYDLEHPAKVNSSEQIEAMNYRRGDDIGNVKGHISNKTLYIALNYEEQAGRLNAVKRRVWLQSRVSYRFSLPRPGLCTLYQHHRQCRVVRSERRYCHVCF